MEELYLSWPRLLRSGLESWGRHGYPGFRPRLVLVTGMGGSGSTGDYVAALASMHGGAPVIVSKSHIAPSYIGPEDLVIVISYSGNTLETRKAYYSVLEKKARVAVVTSNGFLEKDAARRNIPVVKVTGGLAPRTALPEMLYATLGIMGASGVSPVSRGDAEAAASFIEEAMKDAVDEAYSIAGFIAEHGGVPVIATHTPLEVLAVRGKNEFNENAKTPVKIDVAPEWAHNDIVGWEKPFIDKWTVIAIRDPDDSVGTKLVGFMIDLYRDKGYPVHILDLRGGDLLQKLLYGSLVLGLASVRLARIRGIDPLETRSIVRYKERAAELLEIREQEPG